MEQQWIEHLRKRFADRKVAPPDGLWESVRDAIDAGNGGGDAVKHRRRAAVVPMWYRRAVAAVACVAVVAVTVWFFAGRDAVPYDAVAVMEPSGDLRGVGGTGALSASGDDVPLIPVRRHAGHSVPGEVRSDGSLAVDAKTPADSIAVVEDVAVGSENTVGDTRRQDNGSVVVRRNRPGGVSRGGDGSQYLASAGDVRSHGGMSVSVYGSGLTGVGASSGASGTSIRPFNSVQSDPVFGKENMLSYFAYGRAEAAEVKVKHRQPIKVGASVRFDLPGRFGVETGVNYSYHSSDITSGDDSGGYATEQKLHYIGIPVAVNYDIWHTDFLEVYASAGGSVELCISGKSHTEYVSGNTVVNTVDADVRDERPQWSVGASAGVQYNFSDVVGVYVEPGVSYYFDNGSGVSTIYKDKPFNFNLNVGLRFTIR